MAYYRPRAIESELRVLMEAFGAVQIAGPKWCGKTTTSKQFARSSVDIDGMLAIPGDAEKQSLLLDSVLEGEKPRLIDEWQSVPGVWNAVRHYVDDANYPGIFILTESLTVDPKKMHHDGAGRIGTVFMRTMSLHESGHSTGRVSLSDLFQGKDRISDYTENGIEAMSRLLVRGGWPGALERSDAAARRIAEMCRDRIVHGISGHSNEFLPDPVRIEAVMSSLSRNTSTTASKVSILGDAVASGCSMSLSTLDRYLTHLRRNYIIEGLLHWSPALRTKTSVRSTKVHHFFDPAVAAMFLDATSEDLLNDFETFGLLFESMVVRDIRSYVQALGGRAYHYRDKDGMECDIIVHLGDGRWGAMDVKRGSEKGIEEGVKRLLRLRNKVNDRYRSKLSFLAIVVSTNLAYTRRDGIHIIPLACLRERGPRSCGGAAEHDDAVERNRAIGELQRLPDPSEIAAHVRSRGRYGGYELVREPARLRIGAHAAVSAAPVGESHALEPHGPHRPDSRSDRGPDVFHGILQLLLVLDVDVEPLFHQYGRVVSASQGVHFVRPSGRASPVRSVVPAQVLPA